MVVNAYKRVVQRTAIHPPEERVKVQTRFTGEKPQETMRQLRAFQLPPLGSQLHHPVWIAHRQAPRRAKTCSRARTVSHVRTKPRKLQCASVQCHSVSKHGRMAKPRPDASPHMTKSAHGDGQHTSRHQRLQRQEQHGTRESWLRVRPPKRQMRLAKKCFQPRVRIVPTEALVANTSQRSKDWSKMVVTDQIQRFWQKRRRGNSVGDVLTEVQAPRENHGQSGGSQEKKRVVSQHLPFRDLSRHLQVGSSNTKQTEVTGWTWCIFM